MDKLLVIDSNNISHIVKFTMKHLSFQEQEVGIVFGFLKYILFLANKFQRNQFVFAWDSHYYNRRDLLPSYKRKDPPKKPKTEEEKEIDCLARKQMAFLESEFLESMGFKNVFCRTGFEADDIIAEVVRNIALDPIVVSTDEDLFQLLGWCTIYNPVKKIMIREKDFNDEYGLIPAQWPLVKCLSGCSSDNIKGIKGVAEQTAAKYIKGKLTRGKIYERIKEEESAMAHHNMPLVRLPMEGLGKFRVQNCKYSYDKFWDAFQRFGFRSFMGGDWAKWKTNFDLK